MTIKDVARIIASEITAKSQRVTATYTDDGKVIISPKRAGVDHGLFCTNLDLSTSTPPVYNTVIEERLFVDGNPVRELKLVGDEGDTFFQRWDSIKTQPRSSDDTNQILDIFSVMLESHINLEARNDIDRGTTRLTDILYENSGKINPVFSQQNDFLAGSVLPEKLDLDSYGNFITWTIQKNAADDIDEWTHITLASTLGLDGDKGKVTALRRFNNSIISFQEKGIAEVLFNSRTQISTTEGVPIEIANSGKVDGVRYITNKYGVKNKWSIVEGKTGLFFIDNLNKIIGVFNGQGIESLSTKSHLDAWVRQNNSTKVWNPVDNGNFVSYYDKIHSDVYFVNGRNEEQPCLVYSEILGGFVGFYDYSEVPMMTNVSDKFVSCKNNHLWLQNEGEYCNFFGERKPFWITWRVAPDNFSDKIWTNLEYRADFLGVLSEKEDTGRTEPIVYDKYAFRYMEKMDEYTYSIRYGEVDYAFAYEYFKNNDTGAIPSGCSSFRKGNILARNLDWKYSHLVDFNIRTANTWGMAGDNPKMDKWFVEDKKNYDDVLYRLLPFFTLDGINKYGVSANVNVVSIHDTYDTEPTVPYGTQEVDLCSAMVVRYVLDHFKTATEAVEFLRNHARIYTQQSLTDMGYVRHWMIADNDKSYVVECLDGRVVYEEHNVMTNFYLNKEGIIPNEDGTFYGPIDSPDIIPTYVNHLPENSAGIERYNTIVNAYDSIESVEDARELLNSIMYTKCYTEKEWYSEFAGEFGLTIDTPYQSFTPYLNAAEEVYNRRSRYTPLDSEEMTWHTTHSCVYDTESMTLDMITQEDKDNNHYHLEFYERIDVPEWEFIDGDHDTFYTEHTFDELAVWNEYQTTGDVAIPSRSFAPSADLYSDTTRKFRIWRMDIPRAKKDVMSGNKFGLDRIRNPWVYVKLKKNIGNFEHDIMQLHDVIVKYFSTK